MNDALQKATPLRALVRVVAAIVGLYLLGGIIVLIDAAFFEQTLLGTLPLSVRFDVQDVFYPFFYVGEIIE